MARIRGFGKKLSAFLVFIVSGLLGLAGKPSVSLSADTSSQNTTRSRSSSQKTTDNVYGEFLNAPKKVNPNAAPPFDNGNLHESPAFDNGDLHESPAFDNGDLHESPALNLPSDMEMQILDSVVQEIDQKMKTDTALAKSDKAVLILFEKNRELLLENRLLKIKVNKTEKAK